MSLAGLLVVCATMTMTHGPAPVHSGCVVAAPHEGFDDHTAPMAKAIGEALKTGWVVAKNYRKTGERRWFDVNRPTQRFWDASGRRSRPRVTDEGKRVYAKYQKHVDLASGETPLRLLVEIHGHNRKATIEGRRTRLRVIELATRGFSEDELKALKKRFERLVNKLDKEDRVQLAVEQLDPEFSYRGVTVPFYFGASGSKRAGSLSEARTKRALHFECPQHVRFDPERRARYTKLFIELLRPLLKR